jgi:hypothetical protein
MSDCNLVDIVDFADSCAASNPYWKMSATDRDLFGTYAQQKLQSQRPATIVEEKCTVDKKDDDCLDSLLDTTSKADDDACGDDDGDTINDDRACDTKGAEAMVPTDGGGVIAPTPKASGRAKSQRWLEYCKEARKDMLAEGILKPDSKCVHQRAREYLSQDGWI